YSAITPLYRSAQRSAVCAVAGAALAAMPSATAATANSPRLSDLVFEFIRATFQKSGAPVMISRGYPITGTWCHERMFIRVGKYLDKFCDRSVDLQISENLCQ